MQGRVWAAAGAQVALLALWAPDAEGRGGGDLAAVGTTAYTAVIAIVNLKARQNTMAPGCPGLISPLVSSLVSPLVLPLQTPRNCAAAARAVGMPLSCALASVGKASRPACRRLR